MVNRALIRLKVVQLLYSYMLSRSDFSIEKPAETSSPDRRFAFQAYAELLLLLLELAGIKVTANRTTPAELLKAIKDTSFAESKMARNLAQNPDVKALISEYADRMPAFDDIAIDAAHLIQTLPAYAELSKIAPAALTASDEIEFWTAALRAIAKHPDLVAIMRQSPDFTSRGLEMGAKMLLQTLRMYSDTRTLLSNCRHDLQRSFDDAYDLYHWLLWLPVEIVRAEDERLNSNARKFLPTEEDLNPDRRFADSKLTEVIARHPQMQAYLVDKGINWDFDFALLPRLQEQILASAPYKEYMAAEGEKTLDDEMRLWTQLFKHVIVPSDVLAEALESISIFWNDDIEVMSSFVIKTLKRLVAKPEDKLLPKFKDQEDAQFGSKLFDAVVANREEYRNLIDEFVNSDKWDTERLALMDIVILEAALAEAVNFPNIPLSVTANEYVEIANWYSTGRAGSFVNGMLAAMCEKLRNEGRIIKNFNSNL